MSLAAKAHASHRKHRGFANFFMPIWIGVAGIGTLVAAADKFWQLGWGYKEGDALLGLGMVISGVLFWAFWNATFKLAGWLNQIFFGPDPIDRDGVNSDVR